jgi:mannose-6-phosphate isomerase-like protein (cupin superfamily)
MQYVIKKSETVAQRENGVSQFHEYPFSFQNASLGVSEIEGRYPQTGFDVDEKVEASWYVESGSGVICIENEECVVEAGDMIHVPAGKKYWIEGKKLKLIVSSSPVWYAEQHKHIEK